MLHSSIYNSLYTLEIQSKYRNRDTEYFAEAINVKSKALAKLNVSSPKFHEAAASLQLHLALYDSLAFGGETCALIMDSINV